MLFKPGSSEPLARCEGLMSTQDLDLWIRKNLMATASKK